MFEICYNKACFNSVPRETMMRYKFVFSCLMMATMYGCATHQSLSNHQPHWAVLVDKSANFYQVDDKLYRSEQLIDDDKQMIHTNNIRTIINLRYFDRNDDKVVFDDVSVNLVNTPLLTWRIRPQEIAQVLYTIEQAQQNGSVLVHCYHGADRTGIIIAMYRIIHQNWSIDEAKLEMKQGDFGYHAVWKNLENLLTPIKVAEVKSALNAIKNQQN